MDWTSELKAALAQDRLFLCAQDIARVADPEGPACHVEVLLRMRSVDGATILPMAFIPAAERHGLIAVLDRWVVSTVLRHMATMDDGDVVYCINLSGASISDETFPRFVANNLSLSGVDGHRLCFEITETVAVANLTDASRIMGELKLLGIRFALDDFGSGLSSFAYLRQLPLDYLKIDGSFVQNIASQRIDRGMVESINHLAHVMGMKTIAEWVGDDQTLGVLQEIGVDFAQGSGVATPQRLQ
jgi:EAL domain-containing protein (putative c-di-GMP-specific phosphodiesterase class I)